jgi:predicted PurR-regulated permease PerM
MLKYKYPITPLDLVFIKRRIDEGSVTDKDRAIYFKLDHIKEYAFDSNKSIQQSIKLIEDYHTKIESPLGAVLFHIYTYLVFDISAASDSYHFANMLSYMYTHDEQIRNETIEQIPYRRFRKTSRLTSNKIKKRWVQKSIDSGIILDKRKITKHWDKLSEKGQEK